MMKTENLGLLHIILNVTITCVLALPNSVGNSLPIMDSPKPVSQHYRILLATHCRLWTYQQLYTRTFSVTLFGKLTTNRYGISNVVMFFIRLKKLTRKMSNSNSITYSPAIEDDTSQKRNHQVCTALYR